MRLSGRESASWYAFAAVSYVGVGVFQKWLLTWFLGPAWLIAVVVAGPPAARAVHRRWHR